MGASPSSGRAAVSGPPVGGGAPAGPVGGKAATNSVATPTSPAAHPPTTGGVIGGYTGVGKPPVATGSDVGEGATGAGGGQGGMGTSTGSGRAIVGGGPPPGAVGGGAPASPADGGTPSNSVAAPTSPAANPPTTGGVIGGHTGVGNPPGNNNDIGGTKASPPISGQAQPPAAPAEARGIAAQAPNSSTGLAKPAEDGISTKIVPAKPCGTAARETDGTTTCVGIPSKR